MKNSNRDSKSELILWGLNITALPSHLQLATLALAMMTSQIMHGLFTEYVAQGALSQLMWSSAAIELSAYSLLAAFELKAGNDAISRSVSRMPEYCVIAIFISLGRGLTWVAYASLSYPTVVVFKSSKILIVMISGLLILRKRFRLVQYTAGVLAVTGLYLVSAADGQTKGQSAKDSQTGIIVACLATLFEGVVSNLQERSLRGGKGSLVEMLFITNCMGSVLLYLIAAANGEMRVFVGEIERSPASIAWLLITVVLAYG
jgi:adenosine 3'-phospho 5'-phosphosulfate transporter B3